MRLLSLAILMAFSLSSFAQSTPNFECKKATLDSQTQEMTFYDVSSYKDDILTLKNAEKIIYNEEKNEILVSNFSEIQIDGTLCIKKKGGTTLRYKIGDKVAYIE